MTDRIAWIGSAELRAGFGLAAAIEALERFLGSDESPAVPPRSLVGFGGGELIVMPAAGAAAAGVKLVTIEPRNPPRGLPLIHSLYVLVDADTLAPLALLDGIELTRLRTAAVSAVATRHLARKDASRLVVFGSGVQAEVHIEAMRVVRPIREVRVVGRSDTADALVARLASERALDVARGEPGDVAGADIVCTCTTAEEPLFQGHDLRPGVHVNAIGSYQPHARELDTATVVSSAVFVEDREAVLAEAGDLRIPIEAGDLDPATVAGDLRAVVTGVAGRMSAAEMTVFKSVGVAWQDLTVAHAAWEALRPTRD